MWRFADEKWDDAAYIIAAASALPSLIEEVLELRRAAKHSLDQFDRGHNRCLAMKDPSPETDLQALLRQAPPRLKEWLQKVENGTEVAPAASILYGVGEGAAVHARQDKDLEWARIAISAYELLARDSASKRESELRKAMDLRAWFIAKMGAVAGDVTLDKSILLRWFETGLRYSPDEALQKITKWEEPGLPLDRRLPLTEVRELRAIKNRLSPIKILADCGELSDESPLHRWLELRSRLP